MGMMERVVTAKESHVHIAIPSYNNNQTSKGKEKGFIYKGTSRSMRGPSHTACVVAESSTAAMRALTFC